MGCDRAAQRPQRAGAGRKSDAPAARAARRAGSALNVLTTSPRPAAPGSGPPSTVHTVPVRQVAGPRSRASELPVQPLADRPRESALRWPDTPPVCRQVVAGSRNASRANRPRSWASLISVVVQAPATTWSKQPPDSSGGCRFLRGRWRAGGGRRRKPTAGRSASGSAKGRHRYRCPLAPATVSPICATSCDSSG